MFPWLAAWIVLFGLPCFRLCFIAVLLWAALWVVASPWLPWTLLLFALFSRVDETTGTMLTISEFHGMDQEVLLKALNVLVKKGKAQIFGQGESQGVKFF